jgi:hypothetical protein
MQSGRNHAGIVKYQQVFGLDQIEHIGKLAVTAFTACTVQNQ